ncbi:hypothetical protein BDV09DRAFT_202104 [Aspergillus tetrazonus]
MTLKSASRTKLRSQFTKPHVQARSHLDSSNEHYRRVKEQFGGKDPFSPDGQPHFELDCVCMFGSAFQCHYPVPKNCDCLTVVVDLVRPIFDPGEPAINFNFFSNDIEIMPCARGFAFSYDLLTKVDGFRELVILKYPWEMPLDNDAEMKPQTSNRALLILS